MAFENTYNLLAEFANTVIENYRNELSEDEKNASGNLYNSITSQIIFNNNTFIVSLFLEDYWKFIEYGRRPNQKFPPKQAILDWIKIKPIIPTENNMGQIPSENSLAFLISRKIAIEGIEANNVLERSLESALEQFYEDLEEQLIIDITNQLITTPIELILF